ncbi:MAG TPA: cytidine deaminase [Phototrophicaceae bacterium]|nr:cytidine deaminase [Phototrophicaceae bacterium]
MMTTDKEVQRLVELAVKASQKAYAPYSHYPVGAALRAKDGTIYTGCNVENAAYPATICAERTALVKAVSEGQHEFDLLVVVTRTSGSPCGVCRQMLFEFAPDLPVIIGDLDGQIHAECRLSDLLPRGFGPQHLE